MNDVGRPAGAPRFGGWIVIPDPIIVEAAGRTGYDWVGLDLQHGTWDLGLAFRGIQLLDALGVPVLIRLGEEELPLIPRVLDHGASGIVVAMVSSPDIVRAAVDRARYQPEGRRSYGGQRYGMRAEPQDISTWRPAIYAMLENREGVDRIGEIAAVPGVAGIHVGPVDLGLGLGLGLRPDRSVPPYATALTSIVAASHAARLPVTMHAVLPEQVPTLSALGFDEFVLSTDIEILRAGFADTLRRARSPKVAQNPGPAGHNPYA